MVGSHATELQHLQVRGRGGSSSFCRTPIAPGATIAPSASARVSAYYGLFAIVPLLTLAILVAGLLFTRQEVASYVDDRLQDLLEVQSADVGARIAAELDAPGFGAGLGFVGLGSLLFAASLVFLALQDALNIIWDEPVRHGVRHTLGRRAFAFLIVLATGAVLVGSLAVQAVAGLLDALVPGRSILQDVVDVLGLVAEWWLAALVIAVLFRYLPNKRVEWRFVVPGGAITALFLAIGTWAIGVYLSRFAVSSLTGAAGAVLLLLVWIYYEAQILLAGAQLTKVLATRQSL